MWHETVLLIDRGKKKPPSLCNGNNIGRSFGLCFFKLVIAVLRETVGILE